MLADILSRYWWMTLLRGLFWILFGIVIFARPGISLLSLTFALGVIMGANWALSATPARLLLTSQHTCSLSARGRNGYQAKQATEARD